MRKRILFIAVTTVVSLFVIADFYFEITSDVSLPEYLRQPKKLTAEEREWLIDHGPLIYGGDNNSPPLRYVDEATGQYRGIVVDYLRALSIEIGTEITYKPLVWEKALEELSKGETDICDMYPSEERSKSFLFTEPIYNQKSVILVPESESFIRGYATLEGKAVAVQKGDYVYEFLSSKVRDIRYSFAADYYQAILLLQEGRVEAVAGDEPVLSYFIDRMNLKGRYRIIDEAIYERESILAVPKSEKELLNILNYGISALNKKNTMEKIHQKWFGISAPFIKRNTSKKILLTSLFFLYVILLSYYLFYLWNSQLKREVGKRTRELYVSRNDLETTFDGLIHLMIVLDRDGRIANANSSFAALAGREKSGIIGRNYRDFPGILHTDKTTDAYAQAFRGQRNCQLELEHGGNVYEMSLFPLSDYHSTDVDRILVMIKDITKIRLSDQKILQSNKMSAIGQLAAGVAHEIRNPLGLIRTYCFALKKYRQDEEQFDKAIGVIESSVERASSIIENLLNFSRISDDHVEAVNVCGLIGDIIELERKVIGKKNIKDEVHCDPLVVCRINQQALKHVLINIISNAVDAMPRGGTLRLSAEPRGNALVLTCSDTGIGIRKEDQEKIFNPFFTTKQPGAGTGLGLYVVYSEVRKMGGDIQVSSEVDKGTTFTITMPLEEAPQ